MYVETNHELKSKLKKGKYNVKNIMSINEYMTDSFKIQLFLEGLTAVAKAGPLSNGKIWFIRNRDVLKSKRVSLRTL